MLHPAGVGGHFVERRLFAGAEHPSDGTRFTLQWIVPVLDQQYQQSLGSCTPNNVDAAFLKNTKLPKPSGVLLHYNYGAAVVKHWGRNTMLLTNQPGIPCPQKVAQPEGRTARSQYSQGSQNLGQAGAAGASGSHTLVGSSGHGNVADSGDWDEDDIMVFLWGNNPHAVERRNNEQKDREDKIFQWRSTISIAQP